MLPTLKAKKHPPGYEASFFAMDSPCTVFIQGASKDLARRLAKIACEEAMRIEQKYSRYREDNIIHAFHQYKPVGVDTETSNMLNFAKQAYEISNGLFDITSGILRKLWSFDGQSPIPDPKQIKAILPYIGWRKVHWDGTSFCLPKGMQVDFGGFGKEYAVDRSLELITKEFDGPVMVNYGGDLRVNRELGDGSFWKIGIEKVKANERNPLFSLREGAVATSGDARRYLVDKKGKRLSHILDPKNGQPVEGAPTSVTVGAPSCLEAGFLSTLAMLKGKEAENFLKAQGVHHWISRVKPD